MYVFAGLRFIFFFIQLAAFALIVLQNTFCVNHEPKDIEVIPIKCYESFKSVIGIHPRYSSVPPENGNGKAKRNILGFEQDDSNSAAKTVRPEKTEEIAVDSSDLDYSEIIDALTSFEKNEEMAGVQLTNKSEQNFESTNSSIFSQKHEETTEPAVRTKRKSDNATDVSNNTAIPSSSLTTEKHGETQNIGVLRKSPEISEVRAETSTKHPETSTIETKTPQQKLTSQKKKWFESTPEPQSQSAHLTQSDNTVSIVKHDTEKLKSVRRTVPGNEWYHMDFEQDHLRINTRTCFNFYFHLAFPQNVSGTPDIVSIMSPIKLNLILIVSSFLLAFLSITVRFVVMKQSSWIHTILHSTIQIACWSFILVKFEIFRQNWADSWSNFDVPFYPRQWMIAEILCFPIIVISAADVLLFKYSDYKLRFEKSQGVYKCIEMQEADTNGSFRSLPTEEES